MSDQTDKNNLVLLAHRADIARTRLKEDVEAIAYKLSPENLKKEAIEATHDVALEAKAQLQRLGAYTKATAQRHPVAVTFALGFGGLLYAGIVKRNRSLLLGALTCGAGLAGSMFLSAKRQRHGRVLRARSSPLIDA